MSVLLGLPGLLHQIKLAKPPPEEKKEKSLSNCSPPPYLLSKMEQLVQSSMQPLAVDHSSRDSLRRRAVSNLQTGDLQDAIRSGLSSYRITKTLAALAPVPSQRYPHDILPECLLLGKAYAQSQEAERASYYLTQASAIADESPYPEISTNAALYSIIAELYMLLGLADQAEKMYNKYQAAVEKGYGLEHLATSDCYNLLGAFFTHHGRYEPALSYCNRALAIRIHLLGPNHQSKQEQQEARERARERAGKRKYKHVVCVCFLLAIIFEC